MKYILCLLLLSCSLDDSAPAPDATPDSSPSDSTPPPDSPSRLLGCSCMDGTSMSRCDPLPCDIPDEWSDLCNSFCGGAGNLEALSCDPFGC